jgi:hypothetical protein
MKRLFWCRYEALNYEADNVWFCQAHFLSNHTEIKNYNSTEDPATVQGDKCHFLASSTQVQSHVKFVAYREELYQARISHNSTSLSPTEVWYLDEFSVQDFKFGFCASQRVHCGNRVLVRSLLSSPNIHNEFRCDSHSK